MASRITVSLLDLLDLFQILVLLVVSTHFIKPLVLESLSCRNALIRVHMKHFLHQINFQLVHNRRIPCLNCLRVRDLGELESRVSWVAVKLIL